MVTSSRQLMNVSQRMGTNPPLEENFDNSGRCLSLLDL